MVEDCLKLMLNLLRNNSSNQTFFREGSYIQRISVFFDLTLDEEELEVGWAAQKVSNMLFMLSVVRTLVSPSNPTQVYEKMAGRGDLFRSEIHAQLFCPRTDFESIFFS